MTTLKKLVIATHSRPSFYICPIYLIPAVHFPTQHKVCENSTVIDRGRPRENCAPPLHCDAARVALAVRTSKQLFKNHHGL